VDTAGGQGQVGALIVPTTDTTTIVRDLAGRGPSIRAEYGPRYGDASGWVGWRCRDCHAVDSQVVLASDSAIYRPSYHDAGCLWKRSVAADERTEV
jgi:hypothetical protein